MASKHLDDTTLDRAQHGDRAALGALIRQHQDAVYACVARVLAGHAELVDDVAQDVFVKVLSALDRFDQCGRASFRTWVLTIAVRSSIDRLRSLGRDRARLAVVDDGTLEERSRSGDDPESTAAGRQLGRRVADAMADLSAEHRAVLVLRAYHDLDYSEIAEVVGLPEGTVKSRISRAREVLRRALAKGGENLE